MTVPARGQEISTLIGLIYLFLLSAGNFKYLDYKTLNTVRTEFWERRNNKLMVLLIADLSHPIAELHPADRRYS